MIGGGCDLNDFYQLLSYRYEQLRGEKVDGILVEITFFIIRNLRT